MKTADILAALKSQLEADTTLADYIKAVFLGVREDITKFPCLILEPVSNIEGDEIHNRQELNFRIAVIGFVNVPDPDKHLVGDSQVKGVLDIENDVKKAISSDRTLGGECYHASIMETRYEVADYPIRSFRIEVDFYFRQNTLTRA